MLNSKQRATLRSMANTLDPIFQVGKGGLNENAAKSMKEALEKRELIKVSVLDNCSVDVKEACDYFCKETGADPVQCIGRKFVLYLESTENKRIEL